MHTINSQKNDSRWVWIVFVLAIYSLGVWGCSGGGDTPSTASAGAAGGLSSNSDDGTTSAEWSRVVMKQLDHTGMIIPHVRAIMDDNYRVHSAFYNSNNSSERPFTVSYFTFDLNNLSASGVDSIQTIDNCNTLSLAIGSGNSPVVGYQGGEIKMCGDADQGDAMFGALSGSAWAEHTGGIGYVPPERNPVIDDGLAGRNMAFSVDATGDFHLVYQYFYEGCDAFGMAYPDLRYVRKDGNAPDANVAEETIEGNVFSGGSATVQNAVGDPVAMAIDNADNPIVFYYASLVSDNSHGLRVARRVNGQWQQEWIDQDVVVDSISCTINRSGSPAVAYYVNDTDGQGERRQVLKYAVESSSNWITRMVDDSSRCGDHCSLAFTNEGNPVIAYYDLETNSGSREKKDLKLATLDGGAWDVEAVSTSGAIGLYNNLWVDENGTTYICSYSETDKTIYLFYR